MKKPTVDARRVKTLKTAETGPGPVIYAMCRDQRVKDNWALLFAQQLALQQRRPLIVAMTPGADYPGMSFRQATFAVMGLERVSTELGKHNIATVLVAGDSHTRLTKLIRQLDVAVLVTDFSPLRSSRQWKNLVSDDISIPFYEVDAHNIIPCWVASDKQEFAAYTFRPKVHRLLGEFLTDFPRLKKHPHAFDGRLPRADWKKVLREISSDRSVAAVTTFESGEAAARKTLDVFLRKNLSDYHELRNDPTEKAQSGLSPYLHFGQISAQRVALEAQRRGSDVKSLESFLEELIVRRELSDNFCFYNDRYDSFEGFPEWARKTLNEHRSDPREYIYSRDEFETAATHDALWNAAQLEMIKTGKMHGYIRMYWAKKILEWSVSPEEALATALYLNDRYELDGNDPNGFVGVAWSLGGVHDRAWFERDIFGKIRYMSESGCRRKFDVDTYIASVR